MTNHHLKNMIAIIYKTRNFGRISISFKQEFEKYSEKLKLKLWVRKFWKLKKNRNLIENFPPAIKQIVILLCVIGASLAANEECASVGTGFVKHPDDTKCSEYISCVKGVAYERSCPYGLYHDKCKQNVCDYPDNLDEKCKCTGAPAPTTCPKEGEISGNLGNWSENLNYFLNFHRNQTDS